MSSAASPNTPTMLQRMIAADPQMQSSLPNHPTQRPFTIGGAKALLFGIPFMAAGVFIELAAFDFFHSTKHAPTWIISLIGFFFLGAGAFISGEGLHDVYRNSIYEREEAKSPNLPWLYDYHWRRDGIQFSAMNSMLKRLLAAVLWYSFLAPFLWVGITKPGMFLFLAVSGLFALIGVAFWLRWLNSLRDLLSHGNSYLAYDSFPYFLGGKLRAQLRAPQHLNSMDTLTLTLRCVQERVITSAGGSNRSSSVVCFELYKDVLTYDQTRLANYQGSQIPIEFQLPTDKPSTNFQKLQPIYWEIEARGKSSLAEYEAYFLVPVYIQP